LKENQTEIYIDLKDYPNEFLLTLSELVALYKDILNNPNAQMYDLTTDSVILNRNNSNKRLQYFIAKPVSKIN
jgi:predicted YcjX-like family ATPase